MNVVKLSKEFNLFRYSLLETAQWEVKIDESCRFFIHA